MAVLAVENPTFQPAMRIISAITNAYPAQVTTTFDHQYVDGLSVRLYFPPGFGMEQAHEKKGYITVTGTDTFTIDIDTTTYSPFVVPVAFPESYQSAHVVPVGEENDSLDSAVRNVLPY